MRDSQRLINHQDRVDMRNSRGEKERATPGFLTWVTRRIVELFTELWSLGWEASGKSEIVLIKGSVVTGMAPFHDAWSDRTFCD